MPGNIILRAKTSKGFDNLELYNSSSHTIRDLMADPNFRNKTEQVSEAIVTLVEIRTDMRPITKSTCIIRLKFKNK